MTALAPILAVVFHVGLTEWGVQRSTVFCDGHDTIRGPSGSPIFIAGQSIADTGGMMGAACDIRAFGTTEGLFTRFGVSNTVAVTGGLIIPFLLVCFTAHQLLRNIEGRARTWSAIFTAASGIAFAMFPLFFLFINRDQLSAGFVLEQLPLVVALTVLAITLLAAGIWLWRARPSN